MRSVAQATWTSGRRQRWIAVVVFLALALAACAKAPTTRPDPQPRLRGLPTGAAATEVAPPVLTLAPDDSVVVSVFGRPELTTTAPVAGNGDVTLPLVGAVAVGGLTPAKAAARIATAYRQEKYLTDPQVTLTLANARSAQISVLGAVKAPGRFPMDARTTVLDALAQAGGVTEDGASVIVLLRPDRTGKVTRYGIDLRGLGQARSAVPTLALRGGDSLFVPPADQFYIYGEVKAPNMYRLEPGMTVVQAISRGGGITPRGSERRIEIKRRRSDGSYVTTDADLGDPLMPDDVIRIKERIF